MPEIKSLVSSQSIFDCLTSSEKELLIANSSFHIFKKGIALKNAQTSSSVIFLLKSGLVKRGQYSKNGREYDVEIIMPNHLFGILSLFNVEHEKPLFFEALTTVEVLCVKKKHFLQLLNENAIFSNALLKLTLNNIVKLEKNQFNLVFNNIEGRVAYFLLQLAKDFSRNIGEELLVEHPLTQQDMASFIGLTRQTINQALVIFKEKGYIYIPERKKILIRNIKQLETIAMY